jgi:hypothetical protein
MVAAAALLAAPAGAVDHNNLDAGRPLGFDDADSLAFNEQALEFGLGLNWPRGEGLKLDLDAEYLYGFARNSHLQIGFDPSLGGQDKVGGAAGHRHGGSLGPLHNLNRQYSRDSSTLSFGLFHNFNRQYGNTPALSVRGDVFVPVGGDSQNVSFRLRGIASKQAGRYGRVHVNVDLNGNPGADRGERELYPGLALGYSHPLGYPTRFDTTGVAMLSVQPGPRSGTGPVVTAGLGVRRQVGYRSVVDLGLQADLVGSNGAPRDRLRFVVGYSAGF